MSDPSAYPTQLPPEQQAIRAKCFHPSGTFVEFPKEDIEKSIVERFEKIAGMYPNRIAVKTSDRQLTYAQLNRAANSLAIDILARSGTEQEAVALLFPKGTSLVVAVLAVLKCGKFFVLLDPTLPKVRLQIDPIKRKFHPPSESLRLSEMFVESPNTNCERLIPELFEKIVQKIVR